MTLGFFERLAGRLQSAIQAEPHRVTARMRLTLEIARLGNRLFSREQGVAWCGVLVPFDLLHAMDVTSCFVEFVGGWLSSIGAVEPMLDAGEQWGYATDCCSYHRAVIGAAVQGMMPEPDFLIATSTPCCGGLAAIENLARHFHKDLYTIHVPHSGGEDGVRYLADQFRSMVEFVSAHTGRSLDPQRLRTAMRNANRARALLVEVYEMAQEVPCPARPKDLVNFYFLFSLLLGTEAAVEVAQAFRNEFAHRIEAKTPGMPGERVRLMWLQNRVQFRSPLEELLEEEFGGAVVIDELNQITWEPIDPDDPYVGLARRALSNPLTSTVERRLANLRRLAHAYHVDGVVNPCHWGCRQGTGARGLIERGLKNVGIPVLNLEVDCVDPRHFSEGQLRTRLQAFIEMIASRPRDSGDIRPEK